MFKFDSRFSWENIKRRSNLRSVERLHAYSSVICSPEELLWYRYGPDYSIVAVFFDSPRPEGMLRRIERIAFPAFEPQPLTQDGDFYRATFQVA